MTDLNNISILGHVAIFWAMNHVRELISYVPISVKYFISINQTQICLTCGRHVTTNSTETCSTVLQLDITSPSCILLIHFVWRLCKTDCTKSWRNQYNTIQYRSSARTWWVWSSLPSLIHCFVLSTLSGTVKMCFRFSIAVTYCECLMFSSRTSCSFAYSAGTDENDSSIHFRLKINSAKYSTQAP